jgi:hypothetical protein
MITEAHVMKRVISTIFAVAMSLWITSAANAQTADEQNDNTHRPITSKGTMAMEFAFGGLGSMQMGAVDFAHILFPGEGETDAVVVYAAGARYFLADELALRALLAFSTSSNGDADVTKSANGKNVSTNFGLGVGVEMHTQPVYAISPYFGAQVSFASASLTNTRTTANIVHAKDASVLATSSTQENKYSGSGFGLGVLAGFDWYVTNGIAIGAEYSLGFSSASASQTIGTTTTDVPSTTVIGIGGADIHLLVHF